MSNALAKVRLVIVRTSVGHHKLSLTRAFFNVWSERTDSPPVVSMAVKMPEDQAMAAEPVIIAAHKAAYLPYDLEGMESGLAKMWGVTPNSAGGFIVTVANDVMGQVVDQRTGNLVCFHKPDQGSSREQIVALQEHFLGPANVDPTTGLITGRYVSADAWCAQQIVGDNKIARKGVFYEVPYMFLADPLTRDELEENAALVGDEGLRQTNMGLRWENDWLAAHVVGVGRNWELAWDNCLQAQDNPDCLLRTVQHFQAGILGMPLVRGELGAGVIHYLTDPTKTANNATGLTRGTQLPGVWLDLSESAKALQAQLLG